MSTAASPAPWPGLAGPTPRRALARPWLPVSAAAALGLASALAVPVLPPLQFAYAAPELHVALETGVALIGLLATAIIVRGCRDGLRLDRLAIAGGLALIAVTGAVLTAMLAVAPDTGPRRLIATSGSLVGVLFLLIGAFAPPRRPAAGPRTAAVAVIGLALAAVAVVAVPVELALGERRPLPPDDLARPDLSRPLAVLALQLALLAGMVVAAFALTRRGLRTGDAFTRRLGLAATFYAFAKLHYLLMPPLGAEFLHLGDVLRLAFCAVLLWAAVREASLAVADRAVRQERSRIARDLHDGVAQELAFIRRRAAQLEEGGEIAGAAERALLDSRWAIEHLARAPGEPLERILSRHAGVIAARTGVAVTFSASGSATAGPEVSDALARILGEAVSNAGHGNATRVHVELSTDPLRLRVIDDGTGFDAAAAGPGFGLGGMRERAALVGADLRVVSGPGAGTEVAVELR